eukprot:507347_1
MADPILGCSSTMNDAYQLTLKPMLDKGIKNQSNSLNVVTKLDKGCHRMSWKEFHNKCIHLSSALHKHGIKPGSIVSTFMWNNARHLELYYSVPCMGAVIHPINIRLHPRELGYIMNHTKPQIVCIDANLLPLFERIPKNSLKSVNLYIVCGDNMKSGGWRNKYHLTGNVIDFDEFVDNYGNQHFNYPTNLSEKCGALLCYTSGTTGNPKGVLYGHRHLVIATLFRHSEYSGTDCILGLPPMFHAAGWGAPYSCISTGARYIMTNTCRDYDQLLDLCLIEKCTKASGIPTMILRIVEQLKKNPHKFAPLRKNLKTLGSGGSTPPPYIINWFWKEWQIELKHGWGMTECHPGTRASRMNRRKHLYQNEEEKAQNQIIQGTPTPMLETKLVNKDNCQQLVEWNGKDIGELLIRGPCVTNRYFRVHRNENFLKGGWFKTGDIITMNSLNEMKIMDRSKDLIKSGGEWIASSDMENYIMKLGDGKNNIKCCAIIGQPHPRWNERPILVVERLNKNNLKLPKKINIINHLKLKYAKFQLIDDILFWDNIPLTGTGKKSKKIIREKLKKENYILPQLRKKK